MPDISEVLVTAHRDVEQTHERTARAAVAQRAEERMFMNGWVVRVPVVGMGSRRGCRSRCL